jgi:Gpi18-like mannosyltransferase
MFKETASSLPQNWVLFESLNQKNRWLYLFIGWDSAWYLSILGNGYSFSDQSYAFFPGLVIASKLFQKIFNNQLFSMFAIVFTFGILWIPIFQKISEKYMNKREALISTLLYAFSPYVFLFTTVIYTEGIYLFFVLLTWFYFEKRDVNKTIFFASISTLIRPVGFLIIIPLILYNIYENKDNRFIQTIKMLFPFIVLFGWFYYCKVSSGDWFASIKTSEWNEMYNFYTWIKIIIPKLVISSLLFPVPWLNQHVLSPLFIIFSITITPFLIYKLFKTDKYAGVYSVIYFTSILGIGAVVSNPRFLSFLFPVWMIGSQKLLQSRISKLSTIIIPLFFIISLIFWYAFITGTFIA